MGDFIEFIQLITQKLSVFGTQAIGAPLNSAPFRGGSITQRARGNGRLPPHYLSHATGRRLVRGVRGLSKSYVFATLARISSSSTFSLPLYAASPYAASPRLTIICDDCHNWRVRPPRSARGEVSQKSVSE